MKFQSVILFLATIFFFCSCEKEVSFENGLNPGGGGSTAGTAVYTLDGGTGNCTNAVINGSYTTGAALDASNTVILQVNVTTIGTYTISSSTADGITFTGSGAFLNTGAQSITLTGSGTPTAAGVYNFTPGANGCTFTITVIDVPALGDSLYYDITVSGVQYKRVASATSDYGFETDKDGTDSVMLLSGISYYNTPAPLGATYFIMGKGLLHNYASATFTDFKNFFLPGSYPFAATGSKNGIIIEWMDPQEKVWNSNNAPGTQTGSNFTINTLEEFNFNGVQLIRIYATFNCTLYDDAGNSIVVTNGKYLGAFEKQ